jgi:hypothetical protein
MVHERPNGDIQIILKVRLAGVLRDPHNPAAGTSPFPDIVQRVWVNLPANDPERRRWGKHDLERLGFTDDDISRLRPRHPNSHSFVGQEVHCRSKTVGDYDFWNLAFPLSSPVTHDVQELMQAHDPAVSTVSVRPTENANTPDASRGTAPGGEVSDDKC